MICCLSKSQTFAEKLIKLSTPNFMLLFDRKKIVFSYVHPSIHFFLVGLQIFYWLKPRDIKDLNHICIINKLWLENKSIFSILYVIPNFRWTTYLEVQQLGKTSIQQTQCVPNVITVELILCKSRLGVLMSL